MDSAVLVSMPQIWGMNVSYATSQATQRASSSSLSSSRYESRYPHTGTDQQAGSRSATVHMTTPEARNHVSTNITSGQGATSTAAAASSSRSTSSSSHIINRSSSAQGTASVSWLCPEDESVYEPYIRLQYETIDAAVAVRRVNHRDQQQTPRPTTPHVAAVTRYSATYPHRPAAAVPTAAPSSIASRLRRSSTSSSGSSRSSSPTRLSRLYRRSSSASAFLSATANQLMSAFSGLSLRSNSSSSSSSSSGRAGSSSSSRRTRRARHPSSPSRHRLSDAQQLSRTPAVLEAAAAAAAAATLPSDSYDDLLALDQFNVKRALRPTVLEQLPRRSPDAEDQKQQRQCLICLEVWQQQQQERAVAAVADERSCDCCWKKLEDMRGEYDEEPAAAADEPFVPEWIRAAMQRAQPEQQQQQQHTDGALAPATAASAFFDADCSNGDEDSTAGLTGSPANSSSSSYTSMETNQQQQQLFHPCPPVSIKQLPCGHEFCCVCINTWLNDHANCPVCRWTFPDEQTHLINMGK